MGPDNPDTPFDVLTTSAAELSNLLAHGDISSVKIVKTYMSHIENHNKSGAKCRAIVSMPLPSQLIAEAEKLDGERAQGRVRGPLHGVPIIVKDVFATDARLGMPTAAGSAALLDARAKRNADVVDNLIEHGLIIIGKANMTEFSGMKGIPGWSATGRMCQPAYIPSGYKFGEYRKGETSPMGSSTGSAVGVACGFSPLSLGTETSGSVVSPAAVAALYALKLTAGSVSMRDTLTMSAYFDTPGVMGKTALDVALAADALLPKSGSLRLEQAAKRARVTELSIGFLDIEKWRLPAGCQANDPLYYEQTAQDYANAKMLLRRNGAKVLDVYMIPPEEYMVGDVNIDELMDVMIKHQAKNGIDRFLQTFEFSRVRSLEDVIAFNKSNPGLEFDKSDYCPNQDTLEMLIKEARPDEDMEKMLRSCTDWAATQGIDKIVSEHGVDVVVCCSDSFYAGVSVASRYPMAVAPLGYVYSSGRPYALQAIAPAKQEETLVRFMAAWESVAPPRRVPELEACAKARVHL